MPFAAQLLKVLGVDDLTEGSFMPPSTSRIAPIHWTIGEESLLDIFLKGLSTRKRPMDLLHNYTEKDQQYKIILPLDNQD